MGAAPQDTKVMLDLDDTPTEPRHAASPTAHLLDELQLYGYRPHADEPDPRPLPDPQIAAGAIADLFDALITTFADTRLEDDLDSLLWSMVDVFHRAVGRVERQLDGNEASQRSSQQRQDGSEIRSLELERLTAEGVSHIERRNAYEFVRDEAAAQFERHTHSPWRPRTGSKVSHKHLTAAVIDSRDFIAARKRADREILIPAGPRIAVTGGIDFNDYNLVWDRLDKALSRHPGMVLMHGGSPKGAEFIACKWANARKIAQIAFRPDWTTHGKAAPFKRNDAIIEALPIGVLVFPGNGIQSNLADKARKLGIPTWSIQQCNK